MSKSYPHIIFNAKIYTLDDDNPTASAIVIFNGQIIALGSDDEILSHFGNGAITHDLELRPVIPGLTDAHIHLKHFALSLKKINCNVATRIECLQLVAKHASETSPNKWILGHGWNQNNWVDGFGSASDLDKVSLEQPVYLTAKSLHAGWANSAALRAAGIDSNRPNPPNGEIQRDIHGKPTGILLENAMKLVADIIPEPQGNELANIIKDAQLALLQMGLTSVHDFDRRACFDALQRLQQQGELHLRVVKNLPVEDLSYAVNLGLRFGFGNDFLHIGGIKAFSDGALGPHTAAMLDRYENDPSNRGMLLLDSEEILDFGRIAVQNGLPLTIHAIGDHANHEALNAFAQLRVFEANQQNSTTYEPLRHRIEHAQLIHPKDAHRLGELEIIASMQPIHATSDMLMADQFWGERSSSAYAWRTQLNHGTTLAFGSDAPVESPNPFWGLHAAVTRQRADGTPGPDGWYPEQRLSIKEALRAYTQGAAFAAGTEKRSGKLAPGFWADLVVLDTDPFHCAPEEIHGIQVVGTMVNGEWMVDHLTR
ncbi:MAG: amidohydrolase [Chloroflexi bacterium]|nr:amidohydrolase [Chloroflexota bacterium]